MPGLDQVRRDNPTHGHVEEVSGTNALPRPTYPLADSVDAALVPNLLQSRQNQKRVHCNTRAM